MKNLIVLALAFTLLSCGNNPKKNDPSPNWASQMQKTASSLHNLIPYIYDEDKFEDKKTRKDVYAKIHRFDQSIHGIDVKSAKHILGDDPYVLASINNLRDLTTRAKTSFERGDYKTSRILLKATTNTCFKCHTRQNIGPQNLVWKNFDIDRYPINPVEKTHISVAMRRYEPAKKELIKFLEDSEIDKQFDINYENALHYYLMISLRAQEDLDPSLKFVTNKINVADTPTPLHYTLKHWRKDLVYWIKNRKKMPNTLKTAEKAIARNSRTNSDRHFINNLMAAQILHGMLKEKITKKEKAKAFFLLGKVYDELIIEGYWDLPEIYYEKCIDFAQSSRLGKKCYQNLRNNIVVGYSGTRGTLIPKGEYKRLERLRKKVGL